MVAVKRLLGLMTKRRSKSQPLLALSSLRALSRRIWDRDEVALNAGKNDCDASTAGVRNLTALAGSDRGDMKGWFRER